MRIEAKRPPAPRDGNWEGWRIKADMAVEKARAEVQDGELYFLSRHGGYFRPHARGYTSSMIFAALYAADVARDYLSVEGLSVIPFSSVREHLAEKLEDAEREVAALRRLLEEPTKAVSELA